jgi:hypothetical protein
LRCAETGSVYWQAVYAALPLLVIRTPIAQSQHNNVSVRWPPLIRRPILGRGIVHKG